MPSSHGAEKNWTTAMQSHMDFCDRLYRQTRVDGDLNWSWYYGIMPLRKRLGLYLKPILKVLHRKKYQKLDFKKDWFRNNAAALWSARTQFQDELSRQQFDSFLLTAVCGFESFYYSRIHFDDLISITKRENFTEPLPKDYMGLPLCELTLDVQDGSSRDLTIIAATEEIDVTNKYHRYFIKRDEVNFRPQPGDVVFDCGSCIGDITMIFAAFVGMAGKVYSFDPVPLHNQFMRAQVARNPKFKDVIVIREVGVSDVSKKVIGSIHNTDVISPGGLAIDTLELVKIDDVVKKDNLAHVDYIKMDIEGAETSALKGAIETLQKFKPKLAISCYHQGSHLWEIPQLIRSINPDYHIYFEQHLPFECDAIVYAI
jgi:FkbM family methyltransferase